MKRWAIGLVVLFGLSCGLVCQAADFNGDGTGDVAIFRASSGLWSVRGITRVYFGGSRDMPVPGDYEGGGTDQIAIFRQSTGLWAARDFSRVYFGRTGDLPVPGDYEGDGYCEPGIFRSSSGLWAFMGVTRFYYGTSGDMAISPGNLIFSGGGTGGLLKTGQTTSYRTGDDGDYEKGTAFSYTDNGDGTVTDNVTGLMWAKDGNGVGCASGVTKTWNEAVDWAEGLSFAGHTDWRLPNRRELESLVDAGRRYPSIDPVFINTKSEWYWSSTTTDGFLAEFAWVVDSGVGTVIGFNKTGGEYVRAVRGGE